MKVIDNVVFGLIWRPAEEGFSKALSATSKERLKPKAVCKLEVNGRRYIGLSTAKVEKNMISAAAACTFYAESKGYRHAAFLTALSDGAYSLVCVAGGLPAPGYDVVGTKESCIELLEEFYSLVSASSDVLIFCDDSDGLFQGSQPYSLLDVIAFSSSEAIKKNVTLTILLGDLVKVGAVAATLLIIAVSYLGYGQYKAYKRDQLALSEAKERAEEAARKNDPLVRFNMALSLFAKTAVTGIDVPALWSQVSSESNEKGSWVRVELKCNQDACEETWEPKSKAVIVWKEWDDFTGDKRLIFNEAKVAVKRKSPLLSIPPSNLLESLFGTQDVLVDWIDKLESTKEGKLSIGEPKPIASIPVVTGKPRFSSRDVSYDGPLWALGIPNKFAGLAFSEVDISTPNITPDIKNIDKMASVKLKGMFYEKN